MERFGIVANVIAVVDLSVKVTALCVDYGKGVKNAKSDIVRLHLEVAGLQSAAYGVQELLRGPSGERLKTSEQLCNAARHCHSQLQALLDQLRPKTAPEALTPIGFRALKWPFQSKEVERIVQDMGRYAQVMNQSLQVDQTYGICSRSDRTEADEFVRRNLLFDLDRRAVLGRLENDVAKGASFDSRAEEHNSTCLPNTRVEILQQISGWILDPMAEAVFWLNGMAGTGKSTISRTIAQTFSGTGHLGASFFFKRGENDRGNMSRFVSTIVADLTRRVPATARYVKAVMEDDPGILRRTMKEQFERLIWHPVSMLSKDSVNRGPIVIIIDALDECENEDDIRVMIRLFSRTRTLLAVRLKIFLTSRPELPIRMGFSRIKGRYQDLILHGIPMPAIEHDISTFLAHEMARIREEYNSLVSPELHLARDWPGQSKIDALVKLATPLFIAASTICRFIAEARIGTPDKQLERILGSQIGRNGTPLGTIYQPILDNLVTGTFVDQREEIIQDFRSVVGTIVTLASPLSISALASMLHIPRRAVEGRLATLHSVLSIPETTDAPVRLFHLSFRDFLVDAAHRTGNDFWINEQESHQEMVTHCLRVLKCLRRDICGIRAPGTHRSAIDQCKVDASIPPEVQYACLYWVYHLQNGATPVRHCDQVMAFLEGHFLHWLESLSLIGRSREGVHLIGTLQLLFKVRGDGGLKRLSEFLDDAMRFVQTHSFAIENTPLQLYSSLLVFSPERSKVRATFASDIPPWISTQPKVNDDWGNCIQTLEGHHRSVISVAFAHDSALVASGSDDRTIRLWRTATGECIRTLEGHDSMVKSVAFSHDSALVVSGAWDQTVRIWRTVTGECIQTLEGHDSWVTSVAFSHDSALVVSGSYDKTVRFWRTITGECIQTLEGHDDWVTSVAFSHDSALVASGSDDRTIRVWRTATGECIQMLKGHSDDVTSVAFSHDSALLVSGSNDETIRVWRTATGECVQMLKGHSDDVMSVAFSHDSALVLSGSSDKAIRVWRTATSECVQTLVGHGLGVNSAAFSHDSALVLSGSYDKTVRIWRTTTNERVHALKGYDNGVSSVVFSHDSTLVVSGSRDKAIRLWRTATGECIQTLKGHSDNVTSVAFTHDSALVASGSDDTTLRVWRTATGECIQTLEGHCDSVVSVAFSHDSALVASGAEDQTIRVWRTATGECLQKLDVGFQPFNISFRADDLYLLTDHGSVAILQVPIWSSAERSTDCASKGNSFLSISADGCWVAWKGSPLLWLPKDYRPFDSAVSGSFTALGSASGHVTIIGVSHELLPDGVAGAGILTH
ncbi:vegetative incompatibility protein HET-E-1 [Purpureocillium lilacinum]|uniref:Vegetative incompatibility protein HET-E-1 n=1 Tax=Purpureocillium lilacinum TaxID=33203 RepID=A0A179F3S6_PURLI|nr:vegetative incompatibility protein HET-E-1 [Purpureocillium lilacinum]OAQ60074.1 vegetative incompatibility protein HET-E-1 [Purpureocillium lilacinum]